MPDLTGKTYVMTGRFNRFKSREIVADMIRAAGGTVANKVTANTTALITNTPESGTKKNKDARLHGVEVITEQEFYDKTGILD